MDKNVGASRQSRVLLGQGALLLQLQHDRESRKHQLPVQKLPGVASWPCHIDHLVHTNTPFPRSLKRQENAQKVPTLHYSFHRVSSSLECKFPQVHVSQCCYSVSESGKKPFQPGYQTRDKHCHFLPGQSANETTRQ